MIAQAGGDYVSAIENVHGVLSSLEQERAFGSKAWVAAQNDLARSQNLAGDFRSAWDSDQVNLKVAKKRGLTSSGPFFAMSSVGCNALRNGGQPLQSRGFVDSVLEDVRREVPTAELPFFLGGCRALADLSMNLPTPPIATLAQATAAAKRAGFVSIANTFGATLVNEDVKRGDLAAAQADWAGWAADEKTMLDAKEHGPEVVRLLLSHAGLDIALGLAPQATQEIAQAAELIAARRQPTNADARDVEMLSIRAAFTSQRFEEASRHAQAALDIARRTAIDPN